jgi:hypothetical protein
VEPKSTYKKTLLRLWIRVPGLGTFFTPRSGIPDGRKSASGSGINIPDPPHCKKKQELDLYCIMGSRKRFLKTLIKGL